MSGYSYHIQDLLAQNMNIEIIDSKSIYHGRVFDVRQDQIRLQNGKTMRLDIVDHPGAVVMVPIDSDGRIWLIRQYRHAARREILELPAGVIEAGENFEEGARRELREEIGMTANTIQKIGEFFIAPGYSTEFLHIYLATDLHPDPLPGDEDEFIQVVPTPAKQALELAQSEQIPDAKTLAAILLALPYLK
jgi:ADP-ribose diphosphatase